MSTLPPTTSLPVIPALDNTLGAFLIGAFVSAALYGATSLQTWYYFQSYPADMPFLKIMVLLLWALETVHSAFNMHGIYWFLVSNYFNPRALLILEWSATASIAISGIIIIIVHLFYARRVYYVSNKNLWLALTIAIIAIVHFGFVLSVSITGLQAKYFANLTGTPQLMARIGLSLSLATDVLIASSLTFYLLRGRTGRKKTDSLVNRLTVHAVNNGILTSATDLVVLVFVIIAPNSLIYLSIFEVVGNLYTNSLLATLNARNAIKAQQDMHLVEESTFRIRPRGTLDTTTSQMFSPRTGTHGPSSPGSRNTDSKTKNSLFSLPTEKDLGEGRAENETSRETLAGTV
jgi:hypothetical protein